MAKNTEITQALSYLECVCVTERASALFAFAKEYAGGLEKAKIKLANGSTQPAAVFAQRMYFSAEETVNPGADDTLSEALYIVTLLTVMAEYDNAGHWTYGSRLLYQLKASGINLHREHISAFLAQEGTWKSNRSKGDLMDGCGSMLARYTAVGVYCGMLMTRTYSFTDKEKRAYNPDNATGRLDELMALRKPTPAETIEHLARTFLPAYFMDSCGEECRDIVDRFLGFLQSTDFYTAPCSTVYHMSCAGGLGYHTVNVIFRLLQLIAPATDARIGEAVLAALCHDLCKIGVYKQCYSSKKVYLAEGESAPEGVYVKLMDLGGRFYWQDVSSYKYEDAMPFGHGRKSLYMLTGFFGGKIGEAVACAIDGHMADPAENPSCLEQLSEQPLTMFLHIADMLASHIDEV